MKAIARAIGTINGRVSDSFHLSDYSVLAVGIIGVLGHPVYWFWWTYVDPQPNESLMMRVAGMIACSLLLLRRYWPIAMARFLPWYYFATVAYTLPFFFTYYLLTSHYSILWSMAELGMVFFLIAIFPSFVVLSLNLFIGAGLAVLCAWVTMPDSIHLDTHLFLYLYLPIFTFGIGAGVVFSYSNMKGITAQARNEALRALAGTIAHEMRNPLSQLRYVLDRVDEALPVVTEARPAAGLSAEGAALLYHHLTYGQLAIDRGLRIIAMTLDEVSAKPVRPDHLAYLSAADTTRKAIDEYGFGDRIERSKVSLIVIEDFVFKVDETVYLFVLFNLIRNALHHSASHPAATITLTVDRQQVIVRDTGPGIAPDMMSELFKPFQTARNPTGTGLGLAYCQRAMRSFGGTVACQSEVGQFTEFTLQFPSTSREEIADHERQIFEQSTPFFMGKRILVVDDDAEQRARVSRVLSKVGVQVSEAENGEVALGILRQPSFWNLVLMDINMPVMDGYTTTEKIRADDTSINTNVPIAGYTAEQRGVARILAQRAGMDLTLSKSCGAVELITTLRALLESGARLRPKHRFEGFSGKTILVADDDTYSRLVAKSYLERCGASVVEAEHGMAVLDRLNGKRDIDAILMDVNMPGMDGVTTTLSIRARTDAAAQVPIIALTGHADVGAVQACLRAGMNEVLVKPVQIGSLHACLARQFARPEALHPKDTAPVTTASFAEEDRPETTKEHDLLDHMRLDELVTLDLLDQTFSSGITQVRALVAQLISSASAHDIHSTHATLHRLLGVSGSIGAKALNAYGTKIYPRIRDAQWPLEQDWLERISALGDRSAEALEAYAAAIHVKHGQARTGDAQSIG
jgi:two-component system, CAI-1 autoinducer sensor kinase/phosphatase CqsS